LRSAQERDAPSSKPSNGLSSPTVVYVAESRRAEARSPSEDIVSTSEQFTGPTQIHGRRTHPRVLPKSLIYVACGESNGGMVLNVSDDGMAISMAIPVGDEAYSNLHVRMNGLAQGIEVHGRLAWTTKSKKRAGIQLVDISDEQRGQIREWLAQEGVRDVNLLPRVSESAASILPAFPGASTLLDKPLAEPRASLLSGLGGTAPEFLGPTHDEPARDEPSFTEDTIVETHSSQGSNPNLVGFRENEWDLASVTMVPRKKSKPEGLSALGLLFLWIAIPSFGIGLIVGRRPLQQWLSRVAAAGKNISHVATPQPEIVSARDEWPGITSSDIDATGPHPIPARSVETLATNSQDVKTPAATKSLVSTPGVVNTKLLNSMSTQELRAIKSPASVEPSKNPNSSELSKLDSKAKPDTVAKPVTGANIFAPSTNASTNAGNASAQRGNSQDKSAVAPGTAHDTRIIAANKTDSFAQGVSKQNSSDQVGKTIPIDSGTNAGTSIHPAAPPSSSAVSHASASTVTSSASSTVTPSARAMPKPEPGIASDANPRIAPNVSPSMASTTTAGTAAKAAPDFDASSSSRSVASGRAPTNLAPVDAQAPLHGVMLVARKNNESFLLRLPVESVPGARSVSLEMQRFVMVPAESRWHRHGPIAKLTVGELLTQAAANQLETASAARAGDAVTVRAFVDKNGSVQDLKPVSGRFALMPRVMHDLREWQFDQTLIDGKPVESEINITVEFRAGPQPSRRREIQAQNSFKP
jgi:hypothetical protein